MSQAPQPPKGMSAVELKAIIDASACRVIGHTQNLNAGLRLVLGEVVKQFNGPQTTILYEPSMTTQSMYPPDMVIIDPVAGVHVLEVKGIEIPQLQEVDPKGNFAITYGSHRVSENPFAQARKAMFAISGAYQQKFADDPDLGMHYWVVLPLVGRHQYRWEHSPAELLFRESLANIGSLLRAFSSGRRKEQGIASWPDDELARIRGLFGDNAAIAPPSERRPARAKPPAGTLGAQFDERALEYKNLGEDQQGLVEERWDEGPRLIRGVAGSGKTVVLAANLARRIERTAPSVFDANEEAGAPLRVAVLCFNRTLVPFIREKVESVYRQRTGGALPAEVELSIKHMNDLLYEWSSLPDGTAPWTYWSVKQFSPEERARNYLQEWDAFAAEHPDAAKALQLDVVYVDEGQDFLPEELELLAKICRPGSGGEPNLVIFYDDAQNLYGRPRPTWSKHGINVTGGRARIMKQCYRNPRPIIQPAFNVLYGAYADGTAVVPGREYGDITSLERMNLIAPVGKEWDVKFARHGERVPVVTVEQDYDQQCDAIVRRIRWLISDQHVRPEDILVLAYAWQTPRELQARLMRSDLGASVSVHVVSDNKDVAITQAGKVTLSTVHSAKGYDAYAVLLADAESYANDVEHRALFYVGCTRALEYLEVFASARTGLALEMERAVASYDARVL
jgi:superfamily I DNA and RNA helicase